jgi:Ca-activated chloride channel family protein
MATAQPIPKLSKPMQRALNNYIIHGNEISHACNIMQPIFIDINVSLNAYLEQQITPLPIKKLYVLYDTETFDVLPMQRFQNIIDDNLFLPKDKIGEILRYAKQSRQLVVELDSLQHLLIDYINLEKYKRDDSTLTQAYTWLRRSEVLYYDLFELQEKTHWSATNLASQYQRSYINEDYYKSITKLEPAVNQARKICRTLRSGNPSNSLSRECLELTRMLNELNSDKEANLQNVPREPNSSFSPERQYDFFIQRGRGFVANALQTLTDSSRQNQIFSPNYYYYNFSAFPLFNRYGDGLTAIFNNYIQASGEYYLLTIELPVIFMPHYPRLPAFDDYRRPNVLPDPIRLAEQLDSLRRDSIEKNIARLDSLQKDSLQKANLQVAPDNNLVFLLDISSSMDAPERLPLIKTALNKLVDFLRPEDKITIITYADAARLHLEPTTGSDKEKIRAAINNISSRNLSDVNLGLTLAYKMAKENFIAKGNNRLILATDGQIKVHRRSQRLIQKQGKKNISLSTLLFQTVEKPAFKANLQEMATLGKGAYHFVQPENAVDIFLKEAKYK